jgi:hypothetical protein
MKQESCVKIAFPLSRFDISKHKLCSFCTDLFSQTGQSFIVGQFSEERKECTRISAKRLPTTSPEV